MVFAWIKKLLFPNTGDWAEQQAARFLKDKGLKILARNFRAGHDELDIVAQEKGQLVFVEVRARKAEAIVRGALTLDKRKHTALRRAVKAYLRQKTHTNPPWRFDVVEVSYRTRKDFEIYHFPRWSL